MGAVVADIVNVCGGPGGQSLPSYSHHHPLARQNTTPSLLVTRSFLRRLAYRLVVVLNGNVIEGDLAVRRVLLAAPFLLEDEVQDGVVLVAAHITLHGNGSLTW